MIACAFGSPSAINPPNWANLPKKSFAYGFSFSLISPSNKKGTQDLFPSFQVSCTRTSERVLVPPATPKVKPIKVDISSYTAAGGKTLKNIPEADSDKSTLKDVKNTGSDVSYGPGTLTKEKNSKRHNYVASQSSELDYNHIMRHPHVTDSALKAILERNTLVFVVDKHADKKKIKDAAEAMLKIMIKKVNTLMMPDGTKKAYIMLAPGCNGLEVAKKMKLL